MSVLINNKTKYLCKDSQAREGTFHASQAIEYGTKIVGGVTPGRGVKFISKNQF